MRRSGRASLLAILGALGVAVVAALFVFGGESPTSAANRFMSALARGDVEQLTKLSYMGELPESRIREKWEYTTKVASPYYRFTWRTYSELRPTDDTAAVGVMVTRNARPDNISAYEERFGIPLVRKNGLWLVEVRGLARTMYPALPR